MNVAIYDLVHCMNNSLDESIYEICLKPLFEKQGTMARKCHNLRPHTNERHHEEETQFTNSHTTERKKTTKVTIPALFSSVR